MSAERQRTSGDFTETQESAHREQKQTPATHPMVEETPSQENWDCGTEKNKKVSNGKVVRLRTGQLTLATFYEASETPTESGFTRNPELE